MADDTGQKLYQQGIEKVILQYNKCLSCGGKSSLTAVQVNLLILITAENKKLKTYAL
jgi:hypothetical protein